MTQVLKSFDDDGVQFAWDATSLSNYEKCPRYYQYVNLLGYQPKDKSVHLIFGGLYAAALEHYYKYLTEGMSVDDATLAVVRSAMVETWEYDTEPTGEGDEGYPDGVNIIRGSGKPWDSMHSTKTRETLIRSIVWYLDHFADDATEILYSDDGKPGVEYSFALPLDNDIIWCGHIDRLVSYNGDPYVMDQKTSGSTISSRFFKQFTPDIQMSGYTYAGKVIFNLPVKGVIIDAAQIAVGFTRFERGFVHRTEDQLDEWLDNSMLNILRAREDTSDNRFPMNRQSCGNYGGCQFRDVCSASKSHSKRLLAADFVQRPRWDPMERR
jgi:hypothetical protein